MPYKPLEEPDDENGDDGFLKERDLQNHLDAADAPEKDKQKDKEQSGIGDVEFRVNPLEMENLKRDNQIMRALDILVSYNLFSGLRE